jgi:hypothetical protein
LYYLNYDDNRIVIASLECLQVLLKLAPFNFSSFIIRKGSMKEPFLINKLTSGASNDKISNLSENQQSKQESLAKKQQTSTLDLSQNELDADTSLTSLATNIEELRLNKNFSLTSSMESLNTLTSSKPNSNITSSNIGISSTISADSSETNSEKMSQTGSNDDSDATERSAINMSINDSQFGLFLDDENEEDKLNSVETRTLLGDDSTVDNNQQVANLNAGSIEANVDGLGKMYSHNRAPAVYVLRLLAYKYLLNHTAPNDTDTETGNKNEKTVLDDNLFAEELDTRKLKPDSSVKVLLKTLALDCCSSLIAASPKLMLKQLFEQKSSRDSNYTLYIHDLIAYVSHADDKMRMSACLMIGSYLNSVLVLNNGDYTQWLLKVASQTYKNDSASICRVSAALQMPLLIDYLMRLLKYDHRRITNNMSKRYALCALHAFAPTLMQTRHAAIVLDVLVNIIHLRHSTYNLVKCELVDLLASIDYKTLNYIELQAGNQAMHGVARRQQMQERIVNNVFIYLLGSEDAKLRLETARSMTRLVPNMDMYSGSSTSMQNSLLSVGEYLLKQTGHSGSMLTSGLIDNDSHNLLNIFESYANTKTSQQLGQQNSLGIAAPSLFGRLSGVYACSPLSSLSLMSSLPCLLRSNVINNTFVQPFQSFIKYWPSAASFTNTIENHMSHLIEHNLNYVVPVLVSTLVACLDKPKFLGCLETLDYIFQAYSPAIFYASPVSVNAISDYAPMFSNAHASFLTASANITKASYQQLSDLLELFISLLRHPFVTYDLYAHDIVLRLVGTLLSSYAWLEMRRVDKLVQQMQLNVSNMRANPATSSSLLASSVSAIQTIVDELNGLLKPVAAQSTAELATGLVYAYPYSFNNVPLRAHVDATFVHSMRLLCVIACVIDDAALPSQLTSNLSAGSAAIGTSNVAVALPLGPSTIPLTGAIAPTAPVIRPSSPTLKSKLLNITGSKESKNANKSPTVPNTSSITDTGGTIGAAQQQSAANSSSSLFKGSTNIYLGNFQNSPSYMRLYEVLKSSYSSYKKSLSIDSYDRFCQFTKSTLCLFAQLLESSLSVQELGMHLDEILLYMRVIFFVEPSCSIKCVTLCLKTLFNHNLAGLMHDYTQQQVGQASTFLSTHLKSQQASSTSAGLANKTGKQSGLSNVLSTSLTSLASYSHVPSISGTQLCALSAKSKRQRSSLMHTLVLNQLTQFTRFLNSQTALYKSEGGMPFSSLIAGGASLLGVESVALDSTDLATATIGTETVVGSSVGSGSVESSSKHSASQQPNRSTASNSASSGRSFSLFGLLKKGPKEDNVSSIGGSANQTSNDSQQLDKLKQAKTEQKLIVQYIKSFEAIVIKSLRQYTFTTSANLQARILELLNELIYLNVDYSLLDTDNTFINIVLKQFEYLEQKQSSGGVGSGGGGTSSSSGAQGIPNEEGNQLAEAYATDLSEHFDSESTILDPLNPFDTDTMLNKLCSSQSTPYSSSMGAVAKSAGALISKETQTGASSAASLSHSNLIASSWLNLKQHEHQRYHVLIPKMFDFFILLSHIKRPPNQPQQRPRGAIGSATGGFLSIPEIMQLCDNLIASENPLHTHGIAALRPLVVDLFLNRTHADTRELDMQQDVCLATLLRLVHMPSVWPLLTIIALKYKRDSTQHQTIDDKWKKVSRQICDALFDSMRCGNATNAFGSRLPLRFSHYNGGAELRAIRRYSRLHTPHLSSLRELLLLLNCKPILVILMT